MRRERFFITTLASFLMVLFGILVLLILERGTRLGLSMAEKKMKLRAVQELDETRDEIEAQLNGSIAQKAEDVFNEILAQTQRYDPSTEAEAEKKYLSLMEAYLRESFSDPGRRLPEGSPSRS